MYSSRSVKNPTLRIVADKPAMPGNEAHDAVYRTCTVRNLQAQDVDEHAHNLSRWQQLYDQLSAGRFSGALTELWLGQTQVFHEFTSHTLRQSCVVWPDSFWFGVPLRDGNHCKIDAKHMVDDTIALRPGGCDFELLTPDRFDILGVVADAQALCSYALEVEHYDPAAILQQREILQVGAGARRRLAYFILQTLSELQANDAISTAPAAQDALEQSILAGLTSLLMSVGHEPRVSMAKAHRQRLVAQVREHVLAHHDQAITVPDLCRQFHVSRRTLQNCFYQVLGIGPVAYLRSIRLNAVRRELKNPEAVRHTVQDVAAAWGFWHLSQFSADYKRLFGELPSEALRMRFAAM